jgi:hypothetical protein
MTNEEKNAIDQAICLALLKHELRRTGNIPVFTPVDNIALMAGDVVQTHTGTVATVEQRHLDAVELYRKNNGSPQFEGVNFRIQPAA